MPNFRKFSFRIRSCFFRSLHNVTSNLTRVKQKQKHNILGQGVEQVVAQSSHGPVSGHTLSISENATDNNNIREFQILDKFRIRDVSILTKLGADMFLHTRHVDSLVRALGKRRENTQKIIAQIDNNRMSLLTLLVPRWRLTRRQSR